MQRQLQFGGEGSHRNQGASSFVINTNECALDNQKESAFMQAL